MRLAALLGLIALIQAASVPGTRCGIEMRNVALHVADGVVLDVRKLDGEFVSHSKVEPPVFDDPNSYTLRLRSADMTLDGASLTNLLQLALATKKSPLSDVKITIENGELKALRT